MWSETEVYLKRHRLKYVYREEECFAALREGLEGRLHSLLVK